MNSIEGWPKPCTDCNANDFQFQQYFLGNADHSVLQPCNTPGDPVQAYLWLQVTGSATRYSLQVYYELTITDP